MGGSVLAGVRRICQHVAGMRGRRAMQCLKLRLVPIRRIASRTADYAFRLCPKSYGGRVGADPPCCELCPSGGSRHENQLSLARCGSGAVRPAVRRSNIGRMGLPWPLRLYQSVDVKSAGDDRATYFRLRVNLAYRGEPLDFDIVVGCNVRITTYKDNDRTVEVGVAPMLYGLKMTDGHGVVVKPPEACEVETTENGKVPKTLLPLVVTYENADAPWFGIAYASHDAYDSPLSQLKFFGASIEKATREEWREWRRTEAPNFGNDVIHYVWQGLGPNQEDSIQQSSVALC
jgi:hypothetical protein